MPDGNATNSGYTVLHPENAWWRRSNIMKIPQTDLGQQLGATQLGARICRLPPYSASTWHRHPKQEELYYVLRGTGRIRVSAETLTLPAGAALLVAPHIMRQPFNDTAEDVVWLIVGAPPNELEGPVQDVRTAFYPEDPTQLPAELAGHTWPPAG